MSGRRFSHVQRKLEQYKIELRVGGLSSIPIFLFLLFAVIKNDFSVLDHSYWIGVIAYNLLIIMGVWFVLSDHQMQLSMSIVYYAIALSLVIFFAFRDIAFTGDITLGVIDGAKALWNGINPYVENVVRHAIPNVPNETHLSTYAYLPVDLLTYSILLGGMNFISSLFAGSEVPEILPGFNAFGILLSNLVFLGISIFFIRRILQSELYQALALGIAFFTIVIWNNVCLAQTLFFAGWYFHKKEQTNLTITFWTLSMLAKYFAGIFIVAYIVEYIRKRNFIETLMKSAIFGILSLVFLLPFGMVEVINSTVFFYNTEERIADGSFGGSLVSELVLFLHLESIVWVFTVLGFTIILLVAFYLSNLYTRLVVTSLLSLLIISGISAQFFPMIIFILIISNRLIIFDTKDEMRTNNSTNKSKNNVSPTVSK
jgi:hypothetical protein